VIRSFFIGVLSALTIARYWLVREQERSAHHGESIAEDQAVWAQYRAQQEDRWFT